MILVTGGNGQLAQELKLLLSVEQAVFVDHKEGDITNIEQLEKIMQQYSITSIINCAAYTAVDLAESEISQAFLVNETGAFNIAKIAKKYFIPLIHISTDYVFDGKCFLPISEDQVINPLSVYGKSKRAGELKILEVNPNGMIIRTSWLYSNFGKNFVKTILKIAEERKTLNVVYDQVGTPTSAADLARVIVQILPRVGEKGCEVFHYSNEGVISWYDFANAICELRKIKCKIHPIESDEYPTVAKRPFYSVLSKKKIKTKFNLDIPYWKDSLEIMLNSIEE